MHSTPTKYTVRSVNDLANAVNLHHRFTKLVINLFGDANEVTRMSREFCGIQLFLLHKRFA